MLNISDIRAFGGIQSVQQLIKDDQLLGCTLL